MKPSIRISTYLWSAILLLGGIMHFVSPEFYDPFIPRWIPKVLANYGAAVGEILLGIGLLIPYYNRRVAWGLVGLMIIFLPIHIWDIFRENPAIGSRVAAIIRAPIQVGLIVWAYWLAKQLSAINPKEAMN
ncbi:MAG: hypothetical protein AAF399_12605 [Bacteroidota bacterium]